MIKLLLGETRTCSDPLTCVRPVPSIRATSVRLTVSLPVTVRRALIFPPVFKGRVKERARDCGRYVCFGLRQLKIKIWRK